MSDSMVSSFFTSPVTGHESIAHLSILTTIIVSAIILTFFIIYLQNIQKKLKSKHETHTLKTLSFPDNKDAEITGIPANISDDNLFVRNISKVSSFLCINMKWLLI